MNGKLQRCAAALTALLATLALVGGAAVGAHAAGLSSASKDLYLTYEHGGKPNTPLGVMAVTQTGLNAYCVELDVDNDFTFDKEEAVTDSDEMRRIAWLVNRYHEKGKALDHAAIAALVHEHLDETKNWGVHYESAKKDIPELEERVNNLWAESALHAPKDLKVTRAYVEGKRTGDITVEVINKDGIHISGVPYKITLNGPAQFDKNDDVLEDGITVEGTTTDKPKEYSWTATGDGDVTVNSTYDYESLIRLVGKNQDFVRYGGQASAKGTGVTFSVSRGFAPMLTTKVASKTVAPGEPVIDTVTVGMGDESGEWPQGATLKANGYYFAGLAREDLAQGVEPAADDNVQEFLAHLAELGHEPDAYGQAEFTADGQSVDVTAVTEQGGSTVYTPDGTGGFGTWVWGVEVAKQGEGMAELLDGDWVSDFLDPAETTSELVVPEYRSQVDASEAVVGDEIADTIELKGLPEGYGTFQGDGRYGFAADEPYVQVKLWWSGDPDDSTADAQWKPQGSAPPAKEDENHKLVGTWEYTPLNGIIRVGGGEPDAHGNLVTIVAERHGWYAFVLEFPGDDRVAATHSNYDDEHERVLVTEKIVPNDPTDPEDDDEIITDSVDDPQNPTTKDPTITGKSKPLANTGADMLLAFVISLSAAAVGALALAFIKRRTL